MNSNPKALYKYKASPGFASTTQRSFDFRKGAISNKFIMNKLKHQARLANPDLRDGQANLVEDEFEYVDVIIRRL